MRPNGSFFSCLFETIFSSATIAVVQYFTDVVCCFKTDVMELAVYCSETSWSGEKHHS